MNLRRKLIVTYLAVALAPLALVALLGYANARESLLLLQQRSLETTAGLKAELIDNYFDSFRHDAEITSNSNSIRKELPIIMRLAKDHENPEYQQAKKSLDSQIGILIQQQKSLDNVFIADSDGLIVYSAKTDRENELIGEAHPEDGLMALENGKAGAYLSDLYNHAADDTIDFLASAPIKDPAGRLIGVIFFEVNIDELYRTIQDASGFGATGEMLVVRRVSLDAGGRLQSQKHDVNGNGVLYLNPLRFDPKAAFNRTVRIGDASGMPAQEAAQGKSGTGAMIDYRGREVLAVWRYLPENNIGLVFKIDMAELSSPAQATAQAMAVFGIVSMLAIIFIAWLLSMTIVRPIEELRQASEAIAGGNLDRRVSIKTGDEIQRLGEVFNSMALAIKKSRAETDIKVLEQTKQIRERGKVLEDQQKAILNVLEDVEAEKNISDLLAKDLEKFRLAVANASDHIVITDKEGTILFANKGVEMVTGFRISEVLGKKAGISRLWGGLMDKAFYDKLWRTIKTEKKVFSGLVENKRKNSEKYTAQATITPILGKSGEVEFFVAIERDVTKEIQIDRAKTEFVSLASHQLRTPLSAINWYSEMLLAGDAGKLNATQEQYLKEIYSGNQRMVDLVNALLNISRIDLGTFAVEPEPTDFCEVAKSVLAELQPMIAAKKMDVKSDCEKDLPLINADIKLVRIIFQNLLTNALKYTPEKGKVTVSVVKQGIDILIKVADNGYGIPEASKDKIFSKLYRADNIREYDTEGTGLGLYMVKAIVEESAGKVWFESVESKGTTFFVAMPLAGMKKKEGSRELSSIK